MKFNLKETKEKLSKRDKELEFLKQKVLHNEEVNKLQDNDVETLKKEVEELKRRMLQYENESKQEINDLRALNNVEIEKLKESLVLRDNEVEHLKKEVKELTKKKTEETQKAVLKPGDTSVKSGWNNESGASRSAIVKQDKLLSRVQTVVPYNEENMFVWNTNAKEWNMKEWTYSPIFVCHTNGLLWKLGACLWPNNKQMRLGLHHEGNEHNGKVTTFNIDIEFVSNVSNERKVCSQQIVYNGYWYHLSDTSEVDHKP